MTEDDYLRRRTRGRFATVREALEAIWQHKHVAEACFRTRWHNHAYEYDWKRRHVSDAGYFDNLFTTTKGARK